MENKEQFSETVLLIDAAYLENVTKEIKIIYEKKMGRELSLINLLELFTNLSVSCNLAPSDNNVDVLLVHSTKQTHFSYCSPALLKASHNMTYANELGNYSSVTFTVDENADLSTKYLETLQSICQRPEIQRIGIVGATNETMEAITHIIEQTDGKDFTVFDLVKTEDAGTFRIAPILFPVIAALGVTPDDLAKK